MMATTTQETVGVPLTEEQKMQVLQEFGYREAPAPEPMARPGGASGASGSGTTLKGRELVRRHSGASDKARLCLDGQMDMAEDCDDEPKIMTELPQPPHAVPSGGMSSAAAVAQPAGNGDDFWARMDLMFDRKIGNLSNEFGAALHNLRCASGRGCRGNERRGWQGASSPEAASPRSWRGSRSWRPGRAPAAAAATTNRSRADGGHDT